MMQSIRYLKTPDKVRIAWAVSGQGPPFVKAANWLSHLTYDLESPVWRHWIDFLNDHYRLIRYDERGSGMSDCEAADLSAARWGDDLEAVIDASEPGEQFALLGISQGAATAIMYAARYPERISRLILYGGYARGVAHRPQSEAYRRYRAIVDLARLGWGKDNPDELVPFDSGKYLAAEIPNAEFVQLDSRNHILLADEPAWARFRDAVLEFTGRPRGAAAEDPLFATLSARERAILAAVVAGQNNSEIGTALFVSEKTVRNSLTRVFGKLGVRTRTQAAVLARDRGFAAPSSSK
jgi:pimeloyl-ACP methyl ester carboxylesterase/DNA-binding CsgD family transcriptional regulator